MSANSRVLPAFPEFTGGTCWPGAPGGPLPSGPTRTALLTKGGAGPPGPVRWLCPRWACWKGRFRACRYLPVLEGLSPPAPAPRAGVRTGRVGANTWSESRLQQKGHHPLAEKGHHLAASLPWPLPWPRRPGLVGSGAQACWAPRPHRAGSLSLPQGGGERAEGSAEPLRLQAGPGLTVTAGEARPRPAASRAGRCPQSARGHLSHHRQGRTPWQRLATCGVPRGAHSHPGLGGISRWQHMTQVLRVKVLMRAFLNASHVPA